MSHWLHQECTLSSPPPSNLFQTALGSSSPKVQAPGSMVKAALTNIEKYKIPQHCLIFTCMLSVEKQLQVYSEPPGKYLQKSWRKVPQTSTSSGSKQVALCSEAQTLKLRICVLAGLSACLLLCQHHLEMSDVTFRRIFRAQIYHQVIMSKSPQTCKNLYQ